MICEAVPTQMTISEDTLLENGVSPGFPDARTCYLLHHSGNEEGFVACPFYILPLVTHPFSSTAVFQVIPNLPGGQ